MNDKKIIIGTILATVLILVGGIFFFSRSPNSAPAPKVNSSVLVRSDSAKIASESANITLVEFGDYQCPACGSYYPLLKQLVSEFKDNLIFVFRNYPLDQHQNARLAASAAEAAGNQGKYWQMHDLLYENQATWSDDNNARNTFIQYASSLNLNEQHFKADLDADSIKKKIERDIQDGNSLGVDATPTFFLDSEKIQNPTSYDDFKTLVKAAILQSPITQTPAQQYHIHFNLKVVLDNGQAVDFSQNKFQSSKQQELNPDIHFHDNLGDLVHIHKKDVTLTDLFRSFKISLTPDCFTLDTGEKFCSVNGKTLQIYVNGELNNQFGDYQPHDLDRILIVYGQDAATVQQLIKSVPDTACIYSLKCPQRGKPPTEHCVGRLGSNCQD